MTPAMGLIAESAVAATTDAGQTQAAPVDQSILDLFNRLGVRVDGKAVTFTAGNTEKATEWSYRCGERFPSGATVTVSDTQNGSVVSSGSVAKVSTALGGQIISIELDARRTAANQRFSSGWKGEPITVDDRTVATAEQAGYGGVHIVYGALGSSASPSVHGPEGTNKRHADDGRVYSVSVTDRSNGAGTLIILTAAAKGGLTAAEREFAEKEVESHNTDFGTEFTLDTLPGVEARPDYGAVKRGDANGDGVFDAKDLSALKAVSGGKTVAGACADDRQALNASGCISCNYNNCDSGLF